MNREEILAKSRKENRDEGLLNAQHKGMAAGVITLILMYLVISIVSAIKDQPTHAVSAIFWAYIAAEAFPKFRFTRKAMYLAVLITGALASAASLARFLIDVLR